MNDRTIGYLALAVLTSIAAAGIGLAVRTLARPAETWLVRFDNIGTLKLSDPVMELGVVVGRVKRIGRAGDAALLALEFTPPRRIHANYAIQVVDLGIMGDRFVAIDFGSDDHPPVARGDTLRGLFTIGTSEALGMVGQLRDVVRSFAVLAMRLAHGDSLRVPLTVQYARAVWFMDSVSAALLALMKTADALVSERIGPLCAAVDNASRLASDLSERGPDVVERLVNAIQTVDSAVAKMEAITEGIGRAAGVLDGVQGAEMERRLRSVREKLGRVRDLTSELQRRGFKLKVCPF